MDGPRNSPGVPFPAFGGNYPEADARFWFRGVPAGGAKSLVVDATVVLRCGSDRRTTEFILLP